MFLSGDPSEIKFPDSEDIKQDVKAIVYEFKIEKPHTQFNEKQLNISTLQLEAAITITVTGEHSNEIAEKVETRIFKGLSNTLRNLDLD